MGTDRITIPERVADLERQAATLADIAGNLTAIVGALSAVTATIRAELHPDLYDAHLPDLEKDLKRLSDLIDETWPPSAY